MILFIQSNYLIFLSKQVRFTFIGRNADRFEKTVNGGYTKENKIEMALYCMTYGRKAIHLLFVYMHPSSLQTDNGNLLKSFLDEHLPGGSISTNRLYIIGDFNFDCHSHPMGHLPTRLRDLGLHSTMQEHRRTLRQKDNQVEGSISQIDWVFTNREPAMQNTYVYPTWYSDHAALFTEIILRK